MEETITRLEIDGKEIILIGAAHVSKASALEVKEVIERERPDAVCIELDQQRYQSIQQGDKWKNMDIFKVIKEKKATMLLMNLAISSFQNRMAKQFDVTPGAEQIQGIESAREVGAELVLADRDIQVTFARIWANLGFWGKSQLLAGVVFGIFEKDTITEEEMEKMKQQDTLQAVLAEFTESFPRLKQPLIDERDQYLAQKIKTAPGNKIVAVLGAAHVPGITKEIHHTHDLEKLSERPPKSIVPTILGWALPAIIIALIVATFFVNPEAGANQALSWILWTGTMAAIGAAVAFGHPLAVLSAFFAAPITALHPILASGWVSGLVQAFMRKPTVGDFERLSEDVFTVKGFWRNKVTRVLLVVVLTNIFGSIGTIVGGADVIRQFFANIGL
ncbi:TraB/GumN family protein [Chryseomicrobium aureum]|uniref:TraB/GumN family protein n=1 Tax=Chryseomicrobium aureum TaxID=1441723 RepID=UPI00195B7FDE|nr:TraB/GumN family protein [Chryseomicrobium aureum]MBM7707476.1 pheromone shutdown-related protein TraB [Chryseomicrobium aureum]